MDRVRFFGDVQNLNTIIMLYALLFTILAIQYTLIIMNIIFKDTTKKDLKTESIPLLGIFIKFKKEIDKLPKE